MLFARAERRTLRAAGAFALCGVVAFLVIAVIVKQQRISNDANSTLRGT